VATVPLWIVVMRSGLGDRPGRVTVLGVLLGLAGVAMLLLPGGGAGRFSLAYALLVVLAALSWAAGSLLSVRRPLPKDPLALTALEMLAGGLVLFAGSALRGEWSGFSFHQVSARSWLALAYLICFGSLLAFTAYVYLLGSAPVSLVSTYAYVNPAIAVLLGVAIAGERLTALTVAGAAVIVLAVAVVVTEESRVKRRARSSAARLADATRV
jgi:drug/metabolite transporter (DMT)-like permease